LPVLEVRRIRVHDQLPTLELQSVRPVRCTSRRAKSGQGISSEFL
jgi:hypothetical protein